MMTSIASVPTLNDLLAAPVPVNNGPALLTEDEIEAVGGGILPLIGAFAVGFAIGYAVAWALD